MSNKSWMQKFEKWVSKSEQEEEPVINKTSKCKNFEKGKEGVCMFYIRCKLQYKTCGDECALGGRCY